jgi:hypothetical protein
MLELASLGPAGTGIGECLVPHQRCSTVLSANRVVGLEVSPLVLKGWGTARGGAREGESSSRESEGDESREDHDV